MYAVTAIWLLLGSWKESIWMKCHKMLFKLFTNSSWSPQISSAHNVESLDDLSDGQSLLLVQCRGEVSWSTAASPVSGAVDDVMRVMCDEECLDNVQVIAQQLWHKLEAMCLYMGGVPEGHSLASGSISHCMVGLPEGHFLCLPQPGVLKGVTSVTFELFGLFHDEMFSKGGAFITDLLQIFPIPGHVACSLSPLLLKGHSTWFHGELSSTAFHGGLSSVYGGHFGCLGVTIPLSPPAGWALRLR